MRSQLPASFPCSLYAWNLLTVCTKMAALRYFIKRGDPQQCLLKLTEQDCCSSYKYLEVVPWRQLQFTLNRKVDRTIYEASSGNDAMCLLLEFRESQSFSREKATLKRFWMETFCSMEDELTWMGLWNGAVEGQYCCSRREASAELGNQHKRHWTCEQIVC